MITALLLSPVIGILLWLYWYLLPVDAERAGRWRWMDTVLLGVLVLLAFGFVRFAMHADYAGAGPIWPVLVSTVGTYAIFAAGLAAGLILRRS